MLNFLLFSFFIRKRSTVMLELSGFGKPFEKLTHQRTALFLTDLPLREVFQARRFWVTP